MKILALAAAALVYQLFLFLCLGSVVMHLRGKKDYSLSSAALQGYFVYFTLFEVICLPLEVLLVPLRTLALTAGVLSLAAIAAGLYFGYPCWIRAMNSLRYRLKLHGPLVVIMLAVLAASLVFVLLYSDASADSGWYVGTASTALATNTIGRFDPSTGDSILAFKARYALNCYPFHSAVICSLIKGLPVIVQTRSVMSVINVLMSYIAVYLLGCTLFRDSDERREKIRSIRNRPGSYSRRRADLFVCIVFLVNVFSSTIYMPGIFLLLRSFEGKSIIVNLVLPAVLTVCAGLWRETEEGSYRDLFWIMGAAVCFSASSIMAVILACSAVLPLIASRGKWKDLPALLLAILPALAWMILYYLIQHGTIALSTWR